MRFSALTLYIKRVFYLKNKMDFTREICESFFDFTRDLNRSNEIIPTIYELMLNEKEANPELFDSIERRICRASHQCLKAEDFIRLTQTAFRNLTVPYDKKERMTYLGLTFYTAEWIADQSRLCIPGVQCEEIISAIISLLAQKLTDDFGMDTRKKWYAILTDAEWKRKMSEKDGDFDFYAFICGAGLAYFMSRIK